MTVNKRKNLKAKSKNVKSRETVESDDEDEKEENHKAAATPQKSSKKRKILNVESSEKAIEVKRAKKDESNAKGKEFASPAPVTSTPHIKSRKRENTTTSESTADEDPTAINFMVKIPKSIAQDDIQFDASTEKKKKKKKDKSPEKKLNNSIHDSEAEASTSSSVSGSKKIKKVKALENESNRTTVHDSEAEASTSSSVVSDSKKKKKKDKKESDENLFLGERPPSTLLEYYEKFVYSGKPRKMQKSFDKLTQKEKKELTAQHNEKVESYVRQLRAHLSALPKEEAVLWVC